MKEIPLTQGKLALVDDADFDELSQYKWFVTRGNPNLYAARHNPMGGRRGAMVKMHQQLLGTKGGDHRDGNGLNNQRDNLRACTAQQNGMNKRPRDGCASRFKGVHLCKTSKANPWRAQIMVGYKHINLGLYATEKEAAHAYNQKAVDVFGSFARLNII